MARSWRDHGVLKAILLGVWRVAGLAGNSCGRGRKGAYDQARWWWRLSPVRLVRDRQIRTVHFGTENMHSLSILVVDDREEARQGIRALLLPRTDWVICGEASDGIEAIEKAKRLRPNVVLMGISMPRMQGIEATRIIRREVPESDVIIISHNDFGLLHKAAAEAGATGFVDTSRISQDLLKTIDALAKNVTGLGSSGPKLAVNLGNGRGTESLASDTGNLIRKVFMQSPVSMGLLSGPEHRWTFVNPEMIRGTGRSRAEDFIGKTIRESMPELEGQPFFELLDTVYRTGVTHVGTEVKAVLNSDATDQDQDIYFTSFTSRCAARKRK